MPDRYYCAEIPDSGTVMLTDSEAHHLLHVMRAKPGSEVGLFDGQGAIATAEVVKTSRRDATLDVRTRRVIPAPGGTRLTLAVAMPKGERSKWLIEKVTELGADSLIPISSSRSVADPKTNKIDKFRQTVIAACKQSGRAHLMTIAERRTFEELIAAGDASSMLLADPDGDAWPGIAQALPDAVTVIIGPEGGVTDEERSHAIDHGVRAVRFAPHVLRVETAAVAISALIASRLSQP